MPRRKFIRKRRFAKKSKFVKRSRKMKPSHVMVRGPTAVPDYIDVKLKYVEVGAKTAGGVAMSQALYSGNSLYTPSYSGGYGTAHQPISFDQWMTLYRNYFVKASAIKVSFVASAPAAVSLVPCQIVSYPTSIPASFEAARAKSCLTSLANGRTNMKHYMTTSTLYGLKRVSNEDVPYTAQYNADPTNNWLWAINFQDPAGSNNLTMDMRIEITYYCRFFNRINLGTS